MNSLSSAARIYNPSEAPRRGERSLTVDWWVEIVSVCVGVTAVGGTRWFKALILQGSLTLFLGPRDESSWQNARQYVAVNVIWRQNSPSEVTVWFSESPSHANCQMSGCLCNLPQSNFWHSDAFGHHSRAVYIDCPFPQGAKYQQFVTPLLVR